MFRVLDNVPEVYINESRDFLLVSRLYDLMFSGVKYDIDSMVNILDATLVKDDMLLLLCSKVGFFPTIEIDANILKYIIASFPYILKYKGSKLGIEFAINAILKSEVDPSSSGAPIVHFVNKPKEGDSVEQDEYTVYVYTSISLINKLALLEVMKYVLPIGCNYKILSYDTSSQGDGMKTIINSTDLANVIMVKNKLAGSIRSSSGDSKLIDDKNMSDMANRLLGAVDTSIVVGSSIDSNTDDGEDDVIYKVEQFSKTTTIINNGNGQDKVLYEQEDKTIV